MSGTELHKVRITVPKGMAVLTRIELDGEELRGVTVVGLHIDRGLAMVTLTLYADVEIEGELDIVKEWRRRYAPHDEVAHAEAAEKARPFWPPEHPVAGCDACTRQARADSPVVAAAKAGAREDYLAFQAVEDAP